MQIDTLQGTVLAIHDGKATVHLNAAPENGGCGACAHGSSCGIGRLSSMNSNAKPERGIRLHLDAPQGIRAGEQVGLLAPKTSLPLLALLGYVFPAFAMLLGAALGQTLYGSEEQSDVPVALFSLLSFLLALGLVRFVTTRRASCSLSLVPLSNPESPHEH
jgi:sigma-E factor negative regulatory protein RseC